MGREIVYCSQCGVRILEKDLSTGRAFTVLDKVFCAGCRDQAFAEASAPAPAVGKPAARPAPSKVAAAPATRAAAPATRPMPRVAPEGVQAPHGPRTIVRRPNRTPLYVACGVGMLAIVVGIVVILSSGSDGKSKSGTSPVDPKIKEAELIKSLTPEQRAERKLNELQQTAATAKEPAPMLKRIADSEKEIAGTPSEDEYRKLRKRWERKVAEEESGKKIDEVLAQARSIAKGDPDFKRFDPEVRPLLQQAEELAMTDATARVADVKNFRKELEEPYDAAADAWFDERIDRIRMWIREGDPKAALSIISRFPGPLKQSKAWGKLEKMKEDCEKEIAKAAGKDVKDWKDFLRLAIADLQLKNYAKAKDNFLKAEAAMPKLESPNDEDKRRVAWILYYNFACLHAEVSKKQEGAEKSKSVDSAFEYLRKSAEAGVFELPCRCGEREHKVARDHWDKDKDLDTIRSDPRYAEIIQKHVK